MEYRGAEYCGTREADTRKGRRLEYLTLGWNVAEAAIAISAGLHAGSIALVGFGADSVIESLSSLVLLWRLQSHHADERREQLGDFSARDHAGSPASASAWCMTIRLATKPFDSKKFLAARWPGRAAASNRR